MTVSTDGGEEPIWSPRGDELFYRNGDRWMGVEVVPASTFSVGTPQEVFRGPFANIAGLSWDVGADAQRFLVLRSVAGSDDPRPPRLILNWFEEMKAKMDDAGSVNDQTSR